MVRDELGRALAALRRLPGRDREALLLAVAGELATAEAARVLGDLAVRLQDAPPPGAETSRVSSWRIEMAKRYEPDGELDRGLRAALDAPAGAAERIARRSLAEAARPRPRRWPRVALAGAALAAMVLVLLVAVRSVEWGGEAGRAAEGRVVEARYAITNRDRIVVVRSLDGGPSSLHAPGRRASSPPGMMIIVLGETRP